ncbi:MAG: chemotaxis protein CheW [Anaerolineae bacterium]|nr:chemotaxis protein CheW [Anaerolineae bacterium]
MITNHYLSFRIGRYWYGINIASVIEVLQMVSLTELPGAAPEVLGMLTLRDMIMPVTDLRVLFGESEATLTLSTPIIAIHSGENLMGLVVDDVDDVQHIPESAPKETHESRFVSSVVRLESGQTLILVNEEMLHSAQSTTVPGLAYPSKA